MAGKPVVQPTPQVAASMSLDEFASTQRPAPGAAEQWFSERPALRADVIAGFKKHNLMVVYRWLKAVHGFPLTDNALRTFKERGAR